MSFQATHTVAAPRELVWQWHTRPGALTRLSPPFVPMVPLKQAERLSDGTTILGLPAGLKWVARHDLSRYQRGYQFADVCISAPLQKLANWRHIHTFADAPNSHTLITDTVDTRIPGAALESVFAYRQRQLIGDFDFLARMHSLNGAAKPLVIAMTGSRGGVGRALSAQLTTAGHDVIQLVRGKTKPGQRHWDPDSPAPELLEGIDVLVHLAGEPIFGRFNDSHKAEIRDSRVGPTRKLAQLVAESKSTTALVCASAVGIYGPDRGEEPLDENSARGEGFLADAVSDWEAATLPARDAGKRVVNIRTGVALSSASGLLPLLRLLFQTGLGGPFGDGEFWFSWIAHDDLTDIYFRAIVDESMEGPINATSPNPVLNREMVKALGKELGRPTVIPVPTLGPALLLGKEGARELALADQRALPAYLENLGHTFRYPHIQQAFAHELGGEELVCVAD
ncbi:nucleoside-diphosphate sugar epimerase [Corynebacterium phocae]|uniref:Nucleoside-diphosphate sugar epimerase n=1 Tax=Corynebacterium phocae TaxID=161895 RepID=A0A1L7D309_9CORY|nr:TIGR01777 family oxidoreductase [Corynebacterium phocae]APT92457.1 nucleoside-diphosphate sugar epimerase [Corynebacterium phocae]KAA8725061.1 TIGR01777 family protein [Corynebacterium phocae]